MGERSRTYLSQGWTGVDGKSDALEEHSREAASLGVVSMVVRRIPAIVGLTSVVIDHMQGSGI